ncbi:hypothetical protein ACFL35_12320 [Candidatus Riflebacteria bacterium]
MSETDHQSALQKIEKYKKIIHEKTSSHSPNKKSLLLLALMMREMGSISGALFKKNKKILEERLNNLIICILCLASLFRLKIRAFTDEKREK